MRFPANLLVVKDFAMITHSRGLHRHGDGCERQENEQSKRSFPEEAVIASLRAVQTNCTELRKLLESKFKAAIDYSFSGGGEQWVLVKARRGGKDEAYRLREMQAERKADLLVGSKLFINLKDDLHKITTHRRAIDGFVKSIVSSVPDGYEEFNASALLEAVERLHGYLLRFESTVLAYQKCIWRLGCESPQYQGQPTSQPGVYVVQTRYPLFKEEAPDGQIIPADLRDKMFEVRLGLEARLQGVEDQIHTLVHLRGRAQSAPVAPEPNAPAEDYPTLPALPRGTLKNFKRWLGID